jgi:hypothetical protein
MISIEKIVNYKVVDLFELYNYDIKFVFIRLCLKGYEFYYAASIF